jgi:5'-nucleotidase
VVSGINSGANLGDDVLYSGTVAAAMEGRFLNKTPIAISLVGKTHFDTAANVLVNLLPILSSINFPPRTLLNINVPNIPYEEIEGMEVTRLGHRHRSDNPVKTANPRGKESYWISVAGEAADVGDGTDFHAVQHNRVSITPINLDMTGSDMMATLSNGLKEAKL